MRMIIIAKAVFVSVCANAAEAKPDARTLWGLTECASSNTALRLQAAYETLDQWRPLVQEIHSCEDLALDSALSSANGNDDLAAAMRNAVKQDRQFVDLLSSRGHGGQYSGYERHRAFERAFHSASRAGLLQTPID